MSPQRDEIFEVNLGNINNGQVLEAAQHAIEKVLANIRDPNTSAEQKRTMTIKLEWKPNRDRNFVEVLAKVETKLAGLEPTVGSVHISGANGRIRGYIRDIAQDELFNRDQPAAGDPKKPS